MAFNDSKTIIAEGEKKARAMGDRLSGAAGSQPAGEIGELSARRSTERTIDFVEFEGDTRVDPRIVQARVQTKAGQTFDGERLRADVARLYGLDDFQSVTFSVRERDGKDGVVMDLKDKPWGPTYVRFGIHLADDLQGDSNYSLIANVTRTRINALGAEWRNDLRIGHNAF